VGKVWARLQRTRPPSQLYGRYLWPNEIELNLVEGGTTFDQSPRELRTSSEVCSLVSIDLLGRTGLARLHLRVRFAVTDENANVKYGPGRASQDLWTGGNA
jgi:hypothetical protein